MASGPNIRRFRHHIKAPNFQTRLITVTAATKTFVDSYMGGTVVLSKAAGAGTTVTLPAAKGTGNKVRVVVGIASNANIVKVANSTDVMSGGILINDTGASAPATADFWPTASTSDTITFTTVAGGGIIGDWIEVTDILSGVWLVSGVFQGALDPSSPFSATV